MRKTTDRINLIILVLLTPVSYTHLDVYKRQIQADVHVKPISSSITTGFALPPIEDFEQAITPKTKAIMVCNPNNPTGYLYSAAEMETLKQLALKHNLFLFADEAYREFCYEGTHTSAMHLKGAEQHVILMDTISKRYSACGGRIGAFITKNLSLIHI